MRRLLESEGYEKGMGLAGVIVFAVLQPLIAKFMNFAQDVILERLRALFLDSITIPSTSEVYGWVSGWIAHELPENASTVQAVTRSSYMAAATNVHHQDNDLDRRRGNIAFLPFRNLYELSISGFRVWVQHARSDESLGENSKLLVQYVNVYCRRGNGRKALRAIVARGKEILDVQDYFPTVWAMHWGDWTPVRRIRFRSLDTVILPDNTMESLVEDIQRFIDSKDKYERTGVPYHRTYMFEGAPGSGKSASAIALASHFDFDIYIVSLDGEGVSDSNLVRAIARIPQGRGILVFEDVENARELDDSKGGETNLSGGITISGILNMLDGPLATESRITIMTTNYYGKIKGTPLVRAGRVDRVVHFEEPTDTQRVRMFRRFYPEAPQQDVDLFLSSMSSKQSMADLQEVLVRSWEKDYKDFITGLRHNGHELSVTKGNKKTARW